MKKTERIRYEMLLRVRDFGTTNRELFPESSGGGDAFARVARAAAAIDAHTRAKPLAAQEGRQAKAAARAAVKGQMLAIARTARVLAREAPGVENKLRIPRRSSDVALLSTARNFISEAGAKQEPLVRLGLPASLIADLQAAADTLEETMRGRRAGRASVAAAQAGIEAALADGLEAARTLDVIVANTLGDDPVRFAAWRRDRLVVEGRPKAEAGEALPPATTTGTPAAVDEPVDPLQRAS